MKKKGNLNESLKDKTLKIGIASYEEYKARTIAIAKGEYKPRKDEPKGSLD